MAATSIKLPHLVVAVLAAHLLLSIASSSNGQQHHHHHWPAAGISGVHAEPAFLTALQKWIIHLMGSFAERRSRFLLTLGRLHPSLSKAALSLTRSERRRDNNNHHQHHYYYVESPAQALQQAQHYDNVGGAAAGPSANLSPPAVATSADEYELVDAYDSRPYYYEQTWVNSPDGEPADRGSSAAISSAINDQDQYQYQQQQQPSSAGADDDEEHQGYVDLVEAFDARPFYYQQQEEQQQANGQVSHGGGGGSRGKAAARRPSRRQVMRAAAYNEAVREQQLAFLQQQLQLNAEGGFRSLPRWSLPHYLDVPLTNDWTQVSTGENEDHQQPARGRVPNGAEITREYLHQAPQQKNRTNSTAGTDVGEETAVEEGVEIQYIYVTENGQEFPADAVEEVDDTHHHNHQHDAYHDDEHRLQQETQQQGWIGVDQMTAHQTQQNDNRRYFLVPSGPAKVPQHFKTGASAAGHHHDGGQFAVLAGNQHAPFVPHHMLQFSGQGGNAWSPVDSSKDGQMTHVYYYDEYAQEPTSPVGHRPHFPQYVSYSAEEYQDEEYNTEYATEESATVTEEIPTTSDSTVEGGSPLPEKRSNSSTTAEDSTTEQSPENSYSAPQPADATQPVPGASAATVESPREETGDPQLPAADEEQSTVDSGPAVTSIQTTKPTGDKKTARGHSMSIDSPDLQAGLYNYLYPPPAPTKRNPKVHHYLLEFDKRSK